MENPNLRLFEKAQRQALKKGAAMGAKMSDFDALVRKEMQRLESQDALKAREIEHTFLNRRSVCGIYG